MSADMIDAEYEQMALDAYIHAVPQQRGLRTVAAIIADGRPSATSCGLSAWTPRWAVPGDIGCPQCLALQASSQTKSIPDDEVPTLPDWWLRLTGRLPRR